MRSRSERMSLVRLALLFALAGAMVALPVGCSDDSKLPGANVGSGGSGGYGGVLTGPCEDGATRACGIELEKHDNIVSCYVGTQKCEGGVWGQCGDGTTQTMTIQDGPSSQVQATAPVNCTTNPCDPYCWNFNENPDAGLGIDAETPKYQWPGGNLSGYPGGLVNKGLKQPCNDGYDCQFNMQCVHPKTAASCSHSKCLAGAALNATCRSADRCVDEICNADATCCSTNWTAACVAKVGTICDAKCGTTYTSSCAFNPCTQNNTTPLNLACHPCVAKICALNPTCCTTGWDATCVAAVSSVCGSSCPVSMTLPPPEDGTCTPWIPGETDPSCAGVDLAVGVPCANSVPVCNHGSSAAPAGIRIVHYPANSNQYPKCDPDQAHPQMYECFTTKPIPAGECTTDLQYWDGTKWVPGCDKLTGNREIMVNPSTQSGQTTPAGYPGHVTECSCKDNWGLYSGDTCGPPTCASGLSKSTFKKQNLYFILDKSGSMQNSGLWTPAVSSIKTFVQAASSAGLGVALEFFPSAADNSPPKHDGCPGSSCSSAECANPRVPLGTLTAASAPTDAQEKALVDALNAESANGSGTPLFAAIDGATQWAITNKGSKPNEDFSVVLMTDGDPAGSCSTAITPIAAAASAAYLGYGIKTYVAALPGSSAASLDQIAIAGGTGGAIQTSAAGLAAELIVAFQGIANASAKCDFALPNAALYDKNDVTVTLTASNSTKTILTKRTNSGACGTGWYFDNNTTPTKVILCPNTCSAAQSDVGSSVELNVGCPKALAPQTHYFQYEGQCPPGAKPVWSFFSYDTATPGDSTVTFSARTATTQAGLTSSSFHNLATAQSTPTNTQVCPMSGPSPCPIDLFNKLSTPDNILPWLELKVDMTPTTDKLQASLVNSWLVTYSCPPSE
jgi:hypothetical protein